MFNSQVPNIRWLIRRDMQDVLEAEQAEREIHRWTEDDLIAVFRRRDVVGMVIELDYRAIGYMAYELKKEELNLLKLVVHPRHQDNGYGTRMINRLKDKIVQQNRKRITFTIRESNLDAALFLKANGFQCVNVVRDAFTDNFHEFEDGYKFEWLLTEDDRNYPYGWTPIEDAISNL